MYVRNKEKEKARREFLYRTKYLPAYLAFIALYPFGIEDLQGEIWKWIKGYENLYQISNYGRVKSFPRNGTGKEIKILRPQITKFGYLKISLHKDNKSKFFQIHRLVAETFIQNIKNKPQVNHKDGNKFNNYVDNLEWSTIAENNQHAYASGLKNSENNRRRSKLTDEQVSWIRKNYIPRDKEFGLTALSKKFNLSFAAIRKILRGISYKNVK